MDRIAVTLDGEELWIEAKVLRGPLADEVGRMMPPKRRESRRANREAMLVEERVPEKSRMTPVAARKKTLRLWHRRYLRF
jgi:hypothetical protein